MIGWGCGFFCHSICQIIFVYGPSCLRTISSSVLRRSVIGYQKTTLTWFWLSVLEIDNALAAFVDVGGVIGFV